MSSKFSIDGIEEIFRDDVLRLAATMRRALERLQEDTTDARALDDLRATGHSLKGAASLVGLNYLSLSGALYERLAEVGQTLARTDPAQARILYTRLLSGMTAVERLLELSLQRASDDAQEPVYRDLYFSLPEHLRKSFGDHLAVAPPPAGETPPATSGEAGEEDEFARELAEVFAVELQEHLEGVPAEVPLLGNPDTRPAAAHRLNRIFHTIKGSAAMVGLKSLSEAGKRLEKFFEKPELLLTPALDEAQRDVETVFAAANLEPPDLIGAVRRPPAARAPEHEAAAAASLERELLEAFNVDATEAIERSEHLLLGLERRPDDRELLQALFRQFHTLKGAAGAVGLDAVAGQLHEGESLLEAVINGEVAVEGSRLVDFLFRLTDSVVALIGQARGVPDPRRQVMTDLQEAVQALKRPAVGAPERRAAEPAAESAAAEVRPGLAPEAEAGVVRVQAARLDALLNQVGQLVVTRTRMDQKILSFADLRSKLDYCRTRLAQTIEGFQKRFEYTIGEPYPLQLPAAATVEAPRRGTTDEFFTDLEFDKYDDFNILARSVIELASDTGEVAQQIDEFIEALGEEVRQFSKITSGLQRQITNLRLVPIDIVFRRLQRPVRDVARQENKLVDLQFEGADVQLDRGVIDALYTPLLHIVRNAVSHGIELPGVREVSGKPRTGSIKIKASARHNSVDLSVSDDGAGINYDKILLRAIKQGLVDAGNPPPREQLLSLIFRPGFSTAEVVTDVSGRGVGMDVVAQQVAALNGSVLIDSKQGQGTTIRLALPITTSIDEVLLLAVGAQTYALPVDFVERVIAIEEGGVKVEDGKYSLQVDEEEIPALMLAHLVGEPLPTGASVGVVLRGGERAMVLVVDHVRAQQEVVIRPLNRLLEAHPFIAASTLSGAGDIIFVLHVGRLFEIRGMGLEAPRAGVVPELPAVPAEPVAAGAKILVVDDSISVRKLATRFLESDGIEVVTAVDGLDALEKLAEGGIRMVITDLEMPRMHGYDLVQAIRNSPRFAHLPVIVCTSRSTEKHRKHARDVGAEGYVTKPFSKEELLAEILRVTESREERSGRRGGGDAA